MLTEKDILALISAFRKYEWTSDGDLVGLNAVTAVKLVLQTLQPDNIEFQIGPKEDVDG